MPRILKGSAITMDTGNRVSIEVMSPSAFVPVEAGMDEDAGAQETTIENKADYLLIKAKKEAEQIKRRAEMDAQLLMEDVRIQSDKLAKEVAERSRLEGYDRGYQEGMAQTEALRNEAQKVQADAYAEREKIINSIEEDMLQLIIQIVDKLLGACVALNPDVVMHLIRMGLAGATTAGAIFVHVSPDDFEAAVENKDKIVSMADSSANVEIVKDVSLAKSDCIIETSFGNIDCSLDQQFSGIKKELYYLLENR